MTDRESPLPATPRKGRRWRPIQPILTNGDIATVELTRGYVAIIDAIDVPLVEGRRWYAVIKSSGHIYATDGRRASMHRIISGAAKGEFVDHADGNGLNNRRSNIRCGTQSQNQANRSHDPTNILGIKGVSRRYTRYEAKVTHQGKKIHLGTFPTAEEASDAYIRAARAFWGDFAKR